MRACCCEERKKPIEERSWGILERNEARSAFNGYRSVYSDYSLVHCRKCQAVWRTKANYVHDLGLDFKRPLKISPK
jgi:hypothetical protein